MSDFNRRDIIQAGLLSASSLAFLNSCEVIEAGASVGMQAAGLSSEQAGSVINVGKKIAKTFEDFTPEQEYYIGRTVAANIYSQYKPYTNPVQTEYLNLVGLHLAQSSDVPETFGGYHFALLDSDSINAFAAPGGFVFVTKGMLKCCTSEDALAAVLAHEIAHSQLKHGLRAIQSARYSDVGMTILSETAANLSGADLKSVVNLFKDTVSDIKTTMIDTGYSRSLEFEADNLAVKIMDKAGYLNRGLADMLTTMGERLKPGGSDFFKTHPSPKNRLEELASTIDKSSKIPAFRTERLRVKLGQV